MDGGKASRRQGEQASRAEATATAQGRAGGSGCRNGTVSWIAVCGRGAYCAALHKVESPDAHTFLGLRLWQRGWEGDCDPFLVDSHPLSR